MRAFMSDVLPSMAENRIYHFLFFRRDIQNHIDSCIDSAVCVGIIRQAKGRICTSHFVPYPKKIFTRFAKGRMVAQLRCDWHRPALESRDSLPRFVAVETAHYVVLCLFSWKHPWET
jgi:hypothetical protein